MTAPVTSGRAEALVQKDSNLSGLLSRRSWERSPTSLTMRTTRKCTPWLSLTWLDLSAATQLLRSFGYFERWSQDLNKPNKFMQFSWVSGVWRRVSCQYVLFVPGIIDGVKHLAHHSLADNLQRSWLCFRSVPKGSQNYLPKNANFI